MKSIMKIASILLTLLGIAFLGGALPAYLQGVMLQISLLAGTGVVCLVAAIALAVMKRNLPTR